jgi:PAS domain S-box-containing protein
VSSVASVQEELRTERRARALLQAVAVATARSTGLDDVLMSLVREVCRATGWSFGHALRQEGDGHLVSTGIFHLDSPVFERFREASREARFASGIGLPGRVLASRQACWVRDFAAEEGPGFPLPRRACAADVGLHAAFAFPVLSSGRVELVLEFAAAETIDPDEPLLEVVATIGTQLGLVVDRIRAEEALRDSEARLRNVTDSANDAIVTADESGRIVGLNGCAERMFGYEQAEAVGRPLSLLIPRRFRDAHEAGLARMRAGGERRVIGKTVELAGLHRDGVEFPVELSLATWRERDRPFYAGILRDITERKRVEEQLRATSADLARSERDAVEASEAKSLFLANMSHELRTPLNAILGFVQILERDPGLGAPQREHLAVVSRSGEHLLGLINDVLSIAKIEAGEAELHATSFDLRRLLASLRDMFHFRAEARGLALAFELDDGLASHVVGDEVKLRQVLINLLGNAVKFTEKGGVALRARAEGDRVAFEVEDTGAGIAAADLPRLFDPFVQAAEGRRVAEGTGLGLSISQRFVRLMGGELAVRSAPGSGSRFAFSVQLPAASAAQATPTAGRVIGMEAGQPEQRILVVDNSGDNRMLLSHLLRAIGFAVREAADGRAAVEIWRAWSPTFVWMDMRMPVMDGYAATRAIRAEESERGGPRTVIVALTASAFEHDRASILAAGCDEIVAKPFREDRVLSTMALHLGLRWVTEEASPASAAVGEAPAADRVATIAPEIRAELARCLAAGDDLGAERAVDRVETSDAELARSLRRLVRGFRFDELLGALERSDP